MLRTSIKIQKIYKLKRGEEEEEEEEEEESKQKQSQSETERGSECLCSLNKQGS